MSVQHQNPRTFLNRNRIVVKTQELMRSSHKSQQRELIAQQNLILLEQHRRISQRRQRQTGATAGDRALAGALDAIAGLERGLEHGATATDGPTEGPQEHMPEDRPTNVPATAATIFVSIASYRDKECVLTVRDLFAKAEHPDRVHVGVYEQNDPETDKDITISHLIEHAPETIPDLVSRFNSGQLRVMVTPCTDAKGPMYARALIQQNLLQNEQFYMVIDSHSLFEPRWDSICLAEWAKASKLAAKPVLSYYPPNFDQAKRAQTPLQLNPSLKLSYMRWLKFDKNCGFPMPTKQVYANTPREPIRSLFWAACFSFAAASMARDVPFDDSYPYLFLGEEICINLCLFTHGYDVFNPSQHILYHIEDREYRPTFWELFYTNMKPKNASFTVTDAERESRKAELNASTQRMAQLLHHASTRGLGSVRSYEAFCDFIGIDFEKQHVEQHCVLGRTKQPNREELYAKTSTTNAATPIPSPNIMTQVTNRAGHPTPVRTPARLAAPARSLPPMSMANKQQQMMKQHQRNPRTPDGGAMRTGMAATQPPKQIPKTRVPPFSGRPGAPQPRAYANGMWGKA